MITLLPVQRVIAIVAVVYATLFAITVLALAAIMEGPLDWNLVRWAAAGAMPLQIVLLLWIGHGWRLLWRLFPALNRLLFPDLNGHWRMTIHYQRAGQRGIVGAEAIIRQDFVRLSMEVSSLGSDSQTLSATPKRNPESGRPEVHYIYLVTPHAVDAVAAQPYSGAAILRLSPSGPLKLRGNYWTSAETVGHFELSRSAVS